MKHPLETALDDAARLLNEFRSDPQTLTAMEAMVDAISEAFLAGNLLLVCGNGGSMADAMHVAEEFSGRFRADRKPYPAIALSDPAHLTCVANDYGYEHVFSRQVEALGWPGGLLLVLSTSGNSPNLIRAAEVARHRGVLVMGALGRGGGKLLPLCDLVLHAPGVGSDRIQELHMLALHAVIEGVEFRLGHGQPAV